MADGKITIDTGLDTSGFDKGSESMKRALESMLSSANSAGKAMQGSFTGVAEKIQTAAKASQEMGDTAGRFTFAQYIAQAQSDMASLMNTMSKMGKETDKLGTEKGIQQFDASMQNARDAIMALYQRIVQLNGTKVETADYEELRRGADAAAAEVERLQNKQDDLRARGVSTHSRQWLDLEEQIKWAKLALDDYVGELRDGATDGSKMFELGKDSEFAPKLKELAEMYHALAETFQQFNEQLKDADVNMSQQKAATQQAEAEAAKQAEEEAAAEEAAAQAEERHAAVAAALGNVMSALGTILSTVAKAALKELKDELKHLARQLQTLGQWYVRAPFEALEKGAQLATSALGMVKTGAEKTVSALGSVADSVKKAASGFGGLLKKLSLFSKQGGGVGDVATDMVKKLTSLKRMLITRVKRMFISSVFKDMTSAIQAIANKSKTFNAAMSSMQNATKGLTANLAVSFSNLIALVAPIITQIINWITTLITYLNGFFAMLSGAKSIMTAKKATDAYGKSAGGASKKAQELKKQVMGFDEINNLTEQDDSGGGGGAGAGAADFEQKMIDETDDEWLEHVYQTNVFGPFRFIREALKIFLPKNEGCIINISSVNGERPFCGASYTSSKGAINTLTKNVAMRLIDTNIRINAVAPGATVTPAHLANKAGEQPGGAKMLEYSKHFVYFPGPECDPMDQANACLFLASDMGKHVKGQVIQVCNGAFL